MVLPGVGFFAVLTAIFAKAGLQGIDSDFAAFIRKPAIIAALPAFFSRIIGAV